MGGFSSPGGCDPDFDPGCLGSDPSFGQPPIIIVQDTGTAAAIGDISALQQVLAGAVGALKGLAGLIINAIGQAIAALALLWTQILKPLLSAIAKLAQRIRDVIDKVLKPYLAWMKQVRASILDLYNRFVRPIIVIIQKIRQVISIFRLLHIHVLDGLDKQLAKIEGKILRPIYAALYRVNTLGNWVSFILNARLLIWRGLILGSIAANRGGAFSLLASTPDYGWAELPHVDTPTQVPAPPPETFASASAAVDATLPTLATRFASTPASELVACWQTPIGNIDLASAVNDMVTCITS
jgi:hypothetical protein